MMATVVCSHGDQTNEQRLLWWGKMRKRKRDENTSKTQFSPMHSINRRRLYIYPTVTSNEVTTKEWTYSAK
jgi:hypothetical protein